MCGLDFRLLLTLLRGDPGRATGREDGMAWRVGVKGPHRALPCSGRRKVAGSLLVSQERGGPFTLGWDGDKKEGVEMGLPHQIQSQ